MITGPLVFSYDQAISRLVSEVTGKRPWYAINSDGNGAYILTVDNLVHHEHTRQEHLTYADAIRSAQAIERNRIMNWLRDIGCTVEVVVDS